VTLGDLPIRFINYLRTAFFKGPEKPQVAPDDIIEIGTTRPLGSIRTAIRDSHGEY
jgi:hypothetical protein